VISGGMAAGMSAASQARRARPDAEILVLMKTQDVCYGAYGLLYKLRPDTDMDLSYAPPFGRSWSPLLIADSQLNKALD
jgi:NADPH-dependent 2,4-dienoyl-CoA reductase/sulfur reductase-like enzyme